MEPPHPSPLFRFRVCKYKTLKPTEGGATETSKTDEGVGVCLSVEALDEGCRRNHNVHRDGKKDNNLGMQS